MEPVEDVLRGRRRPQGEEVVIRIGEGPTAADRHETRVAVFREDHTKHPSARICPTSNTMPPLTHTEPSSRHRAQRAMHDPFHNIVTEYNRAATPRPGCVPPQRFPPRRTGYHRRTDFGVDAH